MEKWIESIKKLIAKKNVANLLVLLAAAIMVMVVTSDIFVKSSKENTHQPSYHEDGFVKNITISKTPEEEIEERLRAILQRIRGVGEVEVMITFKVSSEIVTARNTVTSLNTTEEKDSNGGTRMITSNSTTENVATVNDGSGSRPLIIKEIKPQVNGVIVVAEGAENIEVKAKLYEAVKTILQIPGHRVEIYPKN